VAAESETAEEFALDAGADAADGSTSLNPPENAWLEPALEAPVEWDQIADEDKDEPFDLSSVLPLASPSQAVCDSQRQSPAPPPAAVFPTRSASNAQKTPHHVSRECLQLSLEEVGGELQHKSAPKNVPFATEGDDAAVGCCGQAFFLVHAVDCLVVLNEEGVSCTRGAMLPRSVQACRNLMHTVECGRLV
jgi:hypothetical protein